MSDGPREIYLLTRDEDGEPIDPQSYEGWLWCEDNTTGCGVKYVRADEIERLRTRVEELEKENRMSNTDYLLQQIAYSLKVIADAYAKSVKETEASNYFKREAEMEKERREQEKRLGY